MVCLVQNLCRVVNVVCLVQNLGEWMDGRKDGWKDGRKEGKAGLRIAYSNQKYKILVITKNCKFCTQIKFEEENVDYLR